MCSLSQWRDLVQCLSGARFGSLMSIPKSWLPTPPQPRFFDSRVAESRAGPRWGTWRSAPAIP